MNCNDLEAAAFEVIGWCEIIKLRMCKFHDQVFPRMLTDEDRQSMNADVLMAKVDADRLVYCVERLRKLLSGD